MTEREVRLAECVFDLTTVAYALIERYKLDIDSREVFNEICNLAEEFETGWDENEDYMLAIEEFGYRRLDKFFGIEVM